MHLEDGNVVIASKAARWKLRDRAELLAFLDATIRSTMELHVGPGARGVFAVRPEHGFRVARRRRRSVRRHRDALAVRNRFIINTTGNSC